MRRLNQFVTVKATSGFTLAYVNTYFLERGPHGEAKLALRFPLPPTPIAGLTLEKSVGLQLAYRGLENAGNQVAIGWQPVGTRALPDFSGVLTTVPLGDDICRLEIAGEYAPPGGLWGRIFDTLVGVHIARATLAALLHQLANATESDYAARLRM